MICCILVVLISDFQSWSLPPPPHPFPIQYLTECGYDWTGWPVETALFAVSETEYGNVIESPGKRDTVPCPRDLNQGPFVWESIMVSSTQPRQLRGTITHLHENKEGGKEEQGGPLDTMHHILYVMHISEKQQGNSPYNGNPTFQNNEWWEITIKHQNTIIKINK